jgi:hypothetical protein
MEKIYVVRFISYSNSIKTIVTSGIDYLDTDDFGNLLIRESELDYYRVYGKGYFSIKFVGYLKERNK